MCNPGTETAMVIKKIIDRLFWLSIWPQHKREFVNQMPDKHEFLD